ncbi:magnesium-translocating P-type ATPase [Herbidospora yilanensis]|uniref:magnesium-translocating P-type ATPase n=1 Tax=Herbidospora yilanensis TaxID=354426 RepID=UPI0018DC2480
MCSGSTLEVLRHLGSGPHGLTEAEAEARMLVHGDNVLPMARPPSWPRRLAVAVRDPFVLVLLVLGLVSALIASWGTAGVIVALVAVSCVLRVRGERVADRSTSALRRLVATTATVVRRVGPGAGSVAREIPVEQLVPGDVVKLGPGDLVPADVRLLRARGLTVHQAALTGESAPVPKSADDVPTGESHLCWQGTSVASGSGLAVVVATGAATRLAGAGRAAIVRVTPFRHSVNGISWMLVRLTVLIPPVALLANALVHDRGPAALPFALAVAVGLTPEMLPVIVTTVLARGAAVLARDREVIVRRLPALHDLGAIDVLCTDKTGTLTQDHPEVERAVDADGRPDPRVLRWAAVNSFWTLHLADLPAPDTLDAAILRAAGDGDLENGVDALPFDPVRRLSVAVVEGPAWRHTLVMKGAVDEVLERCVLDDHARDRARATAAALAADGLRVLAVAVGERTPGHRPHDDERALDLVGFVGLLDRLAPDAAHALTALAERAVTVKVLTGDHPETAARVCRDLGLTPGVVVTGAELEALADDELAELASRTTVFARCTPDHKARVVQALRRAGHTTGFLGDGVNDLPAIGAADVGICPRDAVDVTREAADVVLAAKDLTAIDQAVELGRASTGNVATYLRVALSSNFGNVIAMVTAGVMLPFLPMLPGQVLVQNLCFDAAQLAFAFERPDPAVTRRPARLRPRGILAFIAAFGVLNALADLATFTVLRLALPEADGQAAFHTGWFVENLFTQALVMLLLRPTRRVTWPLGVAVAGLAAVGLLLPLSPFASVLGLVTLPAGYYLLLTAVLCLYGTALAVLTGSHTCRLAQRSK